MDEIINQTYLMKNTESLKKLFRQEKKPEKIQSEDEESTLKNVGLQTIKPISRKKRSIVPDTKLLIAAGIFLGVSWLMTLVSIVIQPSSWCKGHKDKVVLAGHFLLFIALGFIVISLLLFATYLKRVSFFMMKVKHAEEDETQSDFYDDFTDGIEVVQSRHVRNSGKEKVLSKTSTLPTEFLGAKKRNKKQKKETEKSSRPESHSQNISLLFKDETHHKKDKVHSEVSDVVFADDTKKESQF